MTRFAFAFVTLFAVSASATSGRLAPVSELVRSAGLVVVGHAVARESFWEQGRIYTRVELVVDEVWKGETRAGEHLAVLTLGGVVGDIGQRVDGAAEISSVGQHVLFLAVDERGAHHPVAMWQGVFRVTPAPTPGQPARLSRDAARMRIVGEQLATPMPDTLPALRQQVLELSHVR